MESAQGAGVVVKVDTLPYGMGSVYDVVFENGERRIVDDGGLIADLGITRSTTHVWDEGEKAEYDALSARGRTLYDQLRTRLALDHATALARTVEVV